MDDRRKLLEAYVKQLKEGIPFADDYIDKSSDIEENALLARNLSEQALANEVMKNTGIPVPDKTSSLSKKEDFLNRIVKERYPELEPKVRIKDLDGSLGQYGQGEIDINKWLVGKDNMDSVLGTTLHEAGHQYDDQILKHQGKNLDLKALRDLRKDGFDLKNADPAQVYEMYSKGHHANIPNLREGSFGLGALKSYLKSGTFKALPIIGGAATAAAALSSPDASAAVGDALVPGGLESLGPSEEDAAIENPQRNSKLRQDALKGILGK